MSRFISVLSLVIVYALAIFLAFFVVNLGYFESKMLNYLLANISATLLVFVASVIFNNSSVYDPYWSIQPLVIIIGLSLQQTYKIGFKEALLIFLIALYSLRLTLNFLRGWQGMQQEDWRYQNFRKQFPKSYWLVSLGGIHMMPTLWVFGGCLPMFYVFDGGQLPFTFLDMIAAIILAGSIVLAFVADEQKRIFKQSKTKSIVNIGLWKYSRHPNYLGEMLTWFGIFLFAWPGIPASLWTAVGFVAIWILFVFISIPMIEKQLVLKYPAYAKYKRETPKLLPFSGTNFLMKKQTDN